jgi:hypothetical protein
MTPSNDPREQSKTPPGAEGKEELVAPLSPEIEQINAALGNIKKCRELFVVVDHSTADDDSLERTIVLAPRGSHSLSIQEVNALLMKLAPDGVEIDEIDEDVAEDEIECEGELEHEEEDLDQDEEEQETLAKGALFAEFTIEVIVGQKRTNVSVEISNPDIQEIWEEVGGTTGMAEESVEDITYNLQVCLFRNQEEAQAASIARGWVSSE